MRRPQEILLKPVVSEKSTGLMQDNKYTFIVDKRANKVEIKRAVEELFRVTVLNVNTLTVRGKKRRQGRFEGITPERKKAVVTLKPGDKIQILEGL
ncbi:50S ribosomal protein L23 [Clostridiales bacterium PH28_bin88]|nr:50S ribosomal protein L23 [Clostridiales bacterium PH28_bin88]